jgi:2-amino-4-hydroxy-6-hydroxymethyldihydropteridine diphosphokinase
MVIIYVGIGSNLGDKVKNCQDAIHYLHTTPGIEITRASSLYFTEPVGYEDQDWFLNCVVEVGASLTPREVFLKCKEIEKSMGRRPTVRWGPRVIDLDLLFYDELILKEEDLEIPHPRLHERGFVIVPLLEINPGWIHPVLKKTMRELEQELVNSHKVKKICYKYL